MSRRIDIELTSNREDGSWTWRAAGAREPRGVVDAAIVPGDAAVGTVLRAEVEGFLDGLSVVAVMPPRAARAEPERLELKSTRAEQPLVTSTLVPGRSGDRGRRGERGRDRREGRDGGEGRDRRPGRDRPRDRDRDRERDRTRERSGARSERSTRPAPPPVETKPKPKRLRPGKAHRTALLEAVPAEQRPIAEQLLAGGIPSVRQAIDRQNAELREAGKPEVKPDALLRVAEELRPAAQAAMWRDRAEAAAAVIDDLDLRDLRSVVNAAGDAGRDDEAKALAAQLREALTARVEKEQAEWLAELAETVKAGRVVRALRLSSRPPKAGAPIPGDIATQLAETTAASLTEDTGPERWATVLDALAYSPVRRRVIPQSLPAKLAPELKATIARLATRLPDIAHIFDIEPDPAAEKAARGQARRRQGERKDGGRRGGEGGRKHADGKRKPKGAKQQEPRPDEAAPPAEARAVSAEAAAPAEPESRAPEAAPAAETTSPDEARSAAEAASTDEAATTAEAVPSEEVAPAEPESPAPDAAPEAETLATDEAAAAEPEAPAAATDAPGDAAPTPTDEPPTADAPAEPVAEAEPAVEDPVTNAGEPAVEEPASNGTTATNGAAESDGSETSEAATQA
jgi:hypothetical protein